RTLDEISGSFPELPPALHAFPEAAIFDGEILAWSESLAQALPFSELQKRLGRKKVSAELARDVPVVYMVFDVLFSKGELMLEKPLEERRKILEEIFASVPAGGFNVEHGAADEQSQGRLSFETTIGSNAMEPAITSRGIPRVILSPAVTAS